MNLEVCSADAVDFDEIVRLQRTAFADVGGGHALDAVQTAEYYRWKYHTGTGAAKVATVRESGNLVAMNAMFPEMLRIDGGIEKAWQSCDTATHPGSRGKGYFLQCLAALNGTLADGELFFGFPNRNSAPGFRKFGWRMMGTLDAFVRPLPRRAHDTGFREVERFDDSQDALAARLPAPGQIMIDRSAAYLNWRYCSAGRRLYSVFASPDGYCVMRLIVMRGVRIGLVMEAFGVTPAAGRSALRVAEDWTRRAGSRLTLMFGTARSSAGMLGLGFIPIPLRLSPRPLLLMGNAHGAAPRGRLATTWSSQIGDWDGF